MRITLHTQREETIGEAAAHYARTLHTALLSAGAPGRVTTGQHHPDSPAAQEGPRAVWPFVSLRVGGHDVQTLCAHLGRHCRCVRCSDTRHCPQDHHPPARPTINTRCTRNAGATGIAPQHHSSTGSDPAPRTATGTPPPAHRRWLPIPAQPFLRVKTERITMSKTNTTSSTPATSIELVDPASLLVDLNVRHYARLDARSVRASRSSACWCPSSPSVPPRSSFGSGSVTVAPSPRSRPGRRAFRSSWPLTKPPPTPRASSA